jgi:hypothetical protein
MCGTLHVTSLPHYPWHLLNKMTGGPHFMSRRSGEDRNVLSLHSIELRFLGCPVTCLLITLSRLMLLSNQLCTLLGKFWRAIQRFSFRISAQIATILSQILAVFSVLPRTFRVNTLNWATNTFFHTASGSQFNHPILRLHVIRSTGNVVKLQMNK